MPSYQSPLAQVLSSLNCLLSQTSITQYLAEINKLPPFAHERTDFFFSVHCHTFLQVNTEPALKSGGPGQASGHSRLSPQMELSVCPSSIKSKLGKGFLQELGKNGVHFHYR